LTQPTEATTPLSIEYLAAHPQLAPILAGWFARDWGRDDPNSLQRYSAQVAAAASTQELPICLVGLLGGEPVATATLKYREIEFADEADYWLGWVHVREDMRGRGYGTALVAAVQSLAAGMRLSPLYLHTPSAEPFYARLGWRRVATTVDNGAPTTVMIKAV
jgi:GNAT superfamily N-acetyltransferase